MPSKRNDTNVLNQHNTVPFTRPQAPSRYRTIGASVTPEEEAEVKGAMAQAGFASASEGSRTILLAFARSTAVRDAIHQFRREAA